MQCRQQRQGIHNRHWRHTHINRIGGLGSPKNSFGLRRRRFWATLSYRRFVPQLGIKGIASNASSARQGRTRGDEDSCETKPRW